MDPIDGSPPGSPSLKFSRQEHWSGLPFPSPMHESEKCKWSRSVVSDFSNPMDRSLPGSSIHGSFQPIVLEWVAIAFSQSSPINLSNLLVLPLVPTAIGSDSCNNTFHYNSIYLTISFTRTYSLKSKFDSPSQHQLVDSSLKEFVKRLPVWRALEQLSHRQSTQSNHGRVDQ